MVGNTTQVPREALSSQVVWLFVGGAIGQVAAFLLNILLARLLGQAEYGTYRQFLLVHGLLAPVFTIALPASTLYFIAHEDTSEGRRRFVTQTVLLLGLLGMIASGGMLLGAGMFSRAFSNPKLYPYLRYGALYTVFMMSASFLVPTMVAIGKARVSALYSAAAAGTKLVAVLVAAFLCRTLLAVTIALVSSAFFDMILSLWLTKHFLGFSRVTRVRFSDYRAQLSYAVPLGLASVVSMWGIRSDHFLVSAFFGPAIYAIYVIGATEVPFGRLLQSNVNSVLLPEITRMYERGDRNGIIELWRKGIDRTALVMMPLFFLLMLTSEHLIPLLFSEKYSASVVIFRIYLLMIPARLITFGLLLRAAGKTKYDLWGSCIALAVNVGLGYILLRCIGFSGPAWATVLSLFLLISYLMVMTRRYLRFSFRDLLPIRILGKHVLIGVSASSIVYVLNAFVLNNLVPESRLFQLLEICILFGSCYTVLLYKICPEDLRIILRQVKSLKVSMIALRNTARQNRGT